MSSYKAVRATIKAITDNQGEGLKPYRMTLKQIITSQNSISYERYTIKSKLFEKECYIRKTYNPLISQIDKRAITVEEYMSHIVVGQKQLPNSNYI
jgi:hypothetical protein